MGCSHVASSSLGGCENLPHPPIQKSSMACVICQKFSTCSKMHFLADTTRLRDISKDFSEAIKLDRGPRKRAI